MCHGTLCSESCWSYVCLIVGVSLVAGLVAVCLGGCTCLCMLCSESCWSYVVHVLF